MLRLWEFLTTSSWPNSQDLLLLYLKAVLAPHTLTQDYLASLFTSRVQPAPSPEATLRALGFDPGLLTLRVQPAPFLRISPVPVRGILSPIALDQVFMAPLSPNLVEFSHHFMYRVPVSSPSFLGRLEESWRRDGLLHCVKVCALNFILFELSGFGVWEMLAMPTIFGFADPNAIALSLMRLSIGFWYCHDISLVSMTSLMVNGLTQATVAYLLGSVAAPEGFPFSTWLAMTTVGSFCGGSIMLVYEPLDAMADSWDILRGLKEETTNEEN